MDPLKRERTDKEKFAAQKAVKSELQGRLQNLAEQDVAYIITDEERKAFKNLEQRRRARRLHREVLAAAQSQSGFAGE